jgi:uncharacterized membrane protein
VIDEYLRELDTLLRANARTRRRILAEVEEHLRDGGGDEAAIERFGSPAEVAARFNALRVQPPARLVSALVLSGLLFVFAVVQGLDDVLPPAPWPSAADAPTWLRATFVAAEVAFLLAAAAVLSTFIVPRRFRAFAALIACLWLTTCVALLCAHAVLRAGYVPESPSLAMTMLLALLAIGPAAAGLLLLSRPSIIGRFTARLGW